MTDNNEQMTYEEAKELAEEVTGHMPNLEDQPISNFIDSRYEDFKSEVLMYATRDVTSLDHELIRMFANELNLYWRAVADIKENGYTNEHDQVSASVSVRNKAATNLRQLYKEIQKFCDFEDESWRDEMKNF